MPSGMATLALDVLKPAARAISDNRVIERHDIAGRIFHRVLHTRKFLATNYTTIPSAILLAGLAFDDNHESWRGKDFGDLETLQ